MSTTRPEEILNKSINSTLGNVRNILLSQTWKIPDNEPPNTYQTPQRSIDLPKDIFDMVNNIDAAIKSNNKEDKMSAFLQIDAVLTSNVSGQEKMRLASRYLDEVAQTKANQVSEEILKLIEMNISNTQQTIGETPKLGYKPDTDKNYIAELESIKAKVNSIMSPEVNFKDLTTLMNDAFLPLMAKMEEKTKRDGKFSRYYNNFVLPYMESLENKNNSNQPMPAVLSDLTFITKKMMNDFNSVEIKLNSIGEIETKVNLTPEEIEAEKTKNPKFNLTYKKFNLTKTILHQPDYQSVDLNGSDLDHYYDYVRNEAVGILPSGFPDPDDPTRSNENYRKMTAKEYKDTLESNLDYDTKVRYEDCHAGSLAAINEYTGDAYIVMQDLLWKQTINPYIFTDASLPANPVASDALKAMRKNYKADDSAALDDKQIDLVAKEALMAIVAAAIGIKNIKHFSFDPKLSAQMEAMGDSTLEGGRTTSGLAGPWTVPEGKKDEMNLKAGIAAYLTRFSSSSRDSKVSAKFAIDSNNPNIRYIKLNNIGNAMADVALFSKYKNQEKEVVVAPGALILIKPLSKIKHPENYKNINIEEKVVYVVVDNTNGGGPMLEYYSSEIQRLRMDIIELSGNINSNNQDVFMRAAIDPIKNILNSVITETDSQLKNVQIYVAQDKNNVPNLPDGVCAAYVLTQDRKILFVEKDIATNKQTVKELSLKEDFYKIAEGMYKVPEMLQALDTNPVKQQLVGKGDLLNLTYLQKLTNNTSFKLGYSEQESLNNLETRIKQIEAVANADPSMKVKIGNIMDGVLKIKENVIQTQQQISQQDQVAAVQQQPVAHKI
jgi:hypothetical protein